MPTCSSALSPGVGASGGNLDGAPCHRPRSGIRPGAGAMAGQRTGQMARPPLLFPLPLALARDRADALDGGTGTLDLDAAGGCD